MKLLKILLIIAVFWSCSAEYKAVKSVNAELPKAVLLVKFPSALILTNDKRYSWQKGKFTDLEIQQLKRSQSLFLKNLDTENVLQNSAEQLINEFRLYGLIALGENEITQFVTKTSTISYVIDVKQLEAEEYFLEWRDKDVFDDTNLFYQDFMLNAFALNFWAEISSSNQTISKSELLFLQSEDHDQTNGLFEQSLLTGNVSYTNDYDSLSMRDVNRLIENAPSFFAAELLNYIINREIQNRLNSKEIYSAKFNYCYSQKNKKIIRRIAEPPYVLMKQ